MRTRNLNRFFVFAKVFKKVDEIDYFEFLVLLSCTHLRLSNYSNIIKHLSRFKRTMSGNQINQSLNSLVAKGYLDRNGFVYSPTISGKILLTELNDRVKETRVDK